MQQRINERLKAYWAEKCQGRRMPMESDINAEEIADIWPNCFLVDVANSGFEYDYLGNSLIEAYGDDLRGKAVCEALLYPHPVSMLKTFQAAVNKAQPMMDENEFRNTQGVLVKYRACVLPLASAQAPGVCYLIGAMKWKAF